MDGFCIHGQAPVYPAAARLTPEESRQQAVDEAIVELIEADLRGQVCETLAVLYDTCHADAQPMKQLQDTLQADNLNDWLRLLALCKPADRYLAVAGFGEWVRETIAAQADSLGLRRRAEQMLEQRQREDVMAAEGAAFETSESVL